MRVYPAHHNVDKLGQLVLGIICEKCLHLLKRTCSGKDAKPKTMQKIFSIPVSGIHHQPADPTRQMFAELK